MLRVWTPPGYSKEAAPPGGWPVLYMNDGQNMFEDWLAHQVGEREGAGVEALAKSRGSVGAPTRPTLAAPGDMGRWVRVLLELRAIDAASMASGRLWGKTLEDLQL